MAVNLAELAHPAAQNAPASIAAVPDADGDVDTELFATINITPFTDVILVLLIIFMVSSSALVDAAQQGHLDVTLPQAGHASASGADIEPLVIGLTQDGRVFVHDTIIATGALETLLSDTFARAPKTSVIVDADGSLPHQSVVKVIDQVRSAGFLTVGIGAASGP